MKKHLKELLQRRPELAACATDIQAVNAILAACFRRGGRVYLCGNGGSAADCEHWAGELLNGFYSKRPVRRPGGKNLPPELRGLQGGLPAIPLTGFLSLRTAFANDVDPALEYAQLVWALGRPGDV
ncbi:MAG: SIS domain-containing protein, partial [Opitutae bacterium]|nr:SIS domain-containing protein [Opitutae bacterium]